MSVRIDGQVVLITAADKGLGLAHAQVLVDAATPEMIGKL